MSFGDIVDPIENEDVLPFLLPLHEETRISCLHETNLLFTSQEDPNFDRLTAFAKRLFNVPVAMVSLVDSKRVWLKSAVGMDAKGTDSHRNYAFCSHVILPQNPDVFVVADTTVDPRFFNNPNVVDFMKINFYAGAALTIGSVRIGSFCVIDFVPRHDFDVNCVLNLLDLGEAVSCLIRDRRNSYLSMEKEIEKREKDIILASDRQRAKLMLEMMHKVRTPLMSIAMTSSLIESDWKGQKQHNNQNDVDIDNKAPSSKRSDNIELLIVDLQSAVKNLEDVVEASLLLGDAILENDEIPRVSEKIIDKNREEEDDDYSDNYILNTQTCQEVNVNVFDRNHFPAECKLQLFLQEAKNKIELGLVNSNSNLEWTIDNKLSNESYLTYPLLISYIFHILEKDIIKLWQVITIEIWISNITTSNNNSSNLLVNLIIQINASKRISNDTNNEVHFSQMRRRTRTCSTVANEKIDSLSYQNYDNLLKKIFIIEKQLCSVDGSLRVIDFEESEAITLSNNKLFEFHIPCITADIGITTSLSTDALSKEDSQLYYYYSSQDKFEEKEINKKIDDNNIHSSQLLKCLSATLDVEKKVDENKIIKESGITAPNSTSHRSCSSIQLEKSERRRVDESNQYHHSTTLGAITGSTIYHQSNGQEVELTSANSINSINTCNGNSYRIIRNSSRSNNNNNNNNYDEQNALSCKETARSKEIIMTNNHITNKNGKKHTKVKNLFPRVLVVDDSAAIRKVMERWLKKNCCEVVLAENGKAGLILMQQEFFDFVLLDFLMPVMIGRDTLRNFQDWRSNHLEEDLNRDMIIVGMSANSSIDDQNECFQFGMHFFSPKPVNMESLQILLEAKRESNDLQRITRDVLRTCPMLRTYVDKDAIYYPPRKPTTNGKLSPSRTPTNANCITGSSDADFFPPVKVSGAIDTHTNIQDIHRESNGANSTNNSSKNSLKVSNRNVFQFLHKDDVPNTAPLKTDENNDNNNNNPSNSLIMEKKTLSQSMKVNSRSTTNEFNASSAKSHPLSMRISGNYLRTTTSTPIPRSSVVVVECGSNRQCEQIEEQSSFMSRGAPPGTKNSDHSPTSVMGSIATFISSAVFLKKSAKIVHS